MRTPDASISPAELSRRRQAFHALHQSGCFVMPNPWDVGSARLLAQMGFPALATTSAGFAWTMGRPDNGVALDQVLAHLGALASSVEVPVNADFEAGFAVEPDVVAGNVALAVATGVSGLSIEDSTGDADSPLFAFDLAVSRVRAASEAIAWSGSQVLLTGRSEGFLVGRADLGETLRRLTAYAEAGADCLYAPGVQEPADIAAIVGAVAPKPVNVLVGGDTTTVAALAALGVRRISVGGSLARVAWAAVVDAAAGMAAGSFAGLADAVPFAEINDRFRPR